MIIIGRSVVHPYVVNEAEQFFSEKQQVLNFMTENQEVYKYRSVQELAFDLNMRVNLTLSSIDLFSSGLQFRTFQESFCNPEFWMRMANGGFQVKEGALPSFAIRDIFANGTKYGTECATAIIILLYKSLLDLYSENTFNRLFRNMLLYTWDYDKDLKLITKTNGTIVVGDIVYFKNPQVNPRTLHWQGENSVYLGNELFYGHGAGIRTAEQIIQHLNNNRIPNAFISAYLTDFITRVDHRIMSQYASSSKLNTEIKFTPIREDAVIGTLGNTTTVH